MVKSPVCERSEPLREPGREGLHHVGHATHWIVLEGVRVLTDPWIAEPADRILSHRVAPAPLPTHPDVVLVTHRHEDHLDPEALSRLDRSATVVIPRDLVEGVVALGFQDVRGVRAGERLADVRGLAIDVVRGKHDVPEVCYRLERNGRALFFGGDTMLTPEIEALAREKPVDFAVLPGEWSTLLGIKFVLTPPESIELAKRFGAKRAVLTHHESYVSHRWPVGWLVRVPEPLRDEFPDWFVIPSPGEHVPFPWSQTPIAAAGSLAGNTPGSLERGKNL